MWLRETTSALARMGSTAVPNYFGMIVSDGATNNTFGGTVAGARNVISGNFSYGMLVKGPRHERQCGRGKLRRPRSRAA